MSPFSGQIEEPTSHILLIGNRSTVWEIIRGGSAVKSTAVKHKAFDLFIHFI